MSLKPYMLFNRAEGPTEGAFLVFAHNTREARVLGYRPGWALFWDQWTEMCCRVQKTGFMHHADQAALARDEAHVVDFPEGCKRCDLFHPEPLNKDGLCEGCVDDDYEAYKEDAV